MAPKKAKASKSLKKHQPLKPIKPLTTTGAGAGKATF